MLTPFALKSLETVLNLASRLDPQSPVLLEKHIGKVLAITLNPFALTFYSVITAQGIRVVDAYHETPTTTLSGTPLGFIGLSMNPSFTANHVQITGEAEFAKVCQQLLFKPEIDWEEHLSKLVGDAPAQLLYQQGEKAYQKIHALTHTLVQNSVEFLQEERDCLPSSLVVETWLSDVDIVRADVDRLQARLNRLEELL